MKTYLWLLVLAALLPACNKTAETGKLKPFAAHYAAGDTLATWQAPEGDSQNPQGEVRVYYPGGKLQGVFTFENGQLKQVQQYGLAGDTLPAVSLTKGIGAISIPNEKGMPAVRIGYLDGRPNGNMEILGLGTQPWVLGGHPVAAYSSSQLAGLIPPDSAATAKPSSKTVGAFDTGQGDQVMVLLKNKEYGKLYDMSLPEYKSVHTKAAVLRYYSYLNQLYGDVQTYTMENYQMAGQKNMEGVQVVYSCKFRYCRGGVMLNFLQEKGKYYFAGLNVQVEPYAPISQIERMIAPTTELLKAGRYEDLYNSCSQRFQQAMPREQYLLMMGELKKLGNLDDFKLYQHQVSIAEGKLVVLAAVEYTIAGKESAMQLTFTEQSKNVFILEGLNM